MSKKIKKEEKKRKKKKKEEKKEKKKKKKRKKKKEKGKNFQKQGKFGSQKVRTPKNLGVPEKSVEFWPFMPSGPEAYIGKGVSWDLH